MSRSCLCSYSVANWEESGDDLALISIRLREQSMGFSKALQRALFICLGACLNLALVACGGGGSGTAGAGSESGLGPAQALPSESLKFQRYFDQKEVITLLRPAHFEVVSERLIDDSMILFRFSEGLENAQDPYQESITLYKLPVNTNQPAIDLNVVQDISADSVFVSGLVGSRRVFDAEVAGDNEGVFRFLEVSFSLNEYRYVLLYQAEKRAFERNIHAVRTMVDSIQLGQTIFDGYDLTSDLSQPGKPAIASDGENFLAVSCRELSDSSNHYELIGRLIYANRSMGEEFFIDKSNDAWGTDCGSLRYKLSFSKDHYILVYASNDAIYKSLVAKRISLAGTVLDTSPIHIVGNDGLQPSLYVPDIVFDGEKTLVVWYESGLSKSIQATFIDQQGEVGVPVVLNEALDTSLGYTPKVEFANGRFLVAWSPHFFRGARSGHAMNIEGMLLDSSGNPLSSEPFIIRKDDGVNPRYMDVASDGKQFVVGWVEGLLGTSVYSGGRYAIYAKSISPEDGISPGALGEVGIEVAGSIVPDKSFILSELSKDFLDVSFSNERFVFTWSSVYSGQFSGLHGVTLSSDLSSKSDNFVIAGTKGHNSKKKFSDVRPSALAASSSQTLFVNMNESFDAWFFPHNGNLGVHDGASSSEQPLPPIPSEVAASLTRENTPRVLDSLISFGVIAEGFYQALELRVKSPLFRGSNNLSQSDSCPLGGSQDYRVYNGGRNETFEFDQCRDFDGDITDGKLSVEYSELDGKSQFSATLSFDGYTLTADDSSINLNGSIRYLLSPLGVKDAIVNIDLAVDAEADTHTALLQYQLPHKTSSFTRAFDFSGQLSPAGIGKISVNSVGDIISFTGKDDRKASVFF